MFIILFLYPQKFRRRVQESTQVLRELEISLRTNHIGWVREFLNEENKGLDVLVEYLSFAQYAVTFDGDSVENNPENSVDKPWSRSIEDLHRGSNLPSPVSGNSISRAGRHSTLRCNALPSRRTLKNSRLVCKKDDVHVCIMCLRAIMNYQVRVSPVPMLTQYVACVPNGTLFPSSGPKVLHYVGNRVPFGT
ncbi:unnamed protein product [Coregonus sp. 'balchen']|nr:unnamed protein product [Coregonus sp. 'balchen']